MRAALAAALLGLLTVGAGAEALPTTVGQMERACGLIDAQESASGAEDAVAVGACFGMMRGVVQVMQANCRSAGMGSRPAGGLSVGEIPTAGDAIRAFRDWADTNPEQADAPAAYGVISALAAAFPCGGRG